MNCIIFLIGKVQHGKSTAAGGHSKIFRYKLGMHQYEVFKIQNQRQNVGCFYSAPGEHFFWGAYQMLLNMYAARCRSLPAAAVTLNRKSHGQHPKQNPKHPFREILAWTWNVWNSAPMSGIIRTVKQRQKTPSGLTLVYPVRSSSTQDWGIQLRGGWLQGEWPGRDMELASFFVGYEMAASQFLTPSQR
jgi:hypothetical protein